jgi:hypothetical protein
MVIRPSDPDRPHRLAAGGPEAAVPAADTRREERPERTASSSPRSDRAELSKAARELFEQLDRPNPGSPALAPERARQVLERLRSGHYDRPDVLDQVAKRVLPDVTGPGSDD